MSAEDRQRFNERHAAWFAKIAADFGGHSPK
jgi:hypothetical protein